MDARIAPLSADTGARATITVRRRGATYGPRYTVCHPGIVEPINQPSAAPNAPPKTTPWTNALPGSTSAFETFTAANATIPVKMPTEAAPTSAPLLARLPRFSTLRIALHGTSPGADAKECVSAFRVDRSPSRPCGPTMDAVAFELPQSRTQSDPVVAVDLRARAQHGGSMREIVVGGSSRWRIANGRRRGGCRRRLGRSGLGHDGRERRLVPGALI